MTASDFAAAILTLAVQFRFSVTSWGRSAARNAAVGGVRGSYHLAFRAVDVVLDPDQDADLFRRRAEELGLEVLTEIEHLHLEPRG